MKLLSTYNAASKTAEILIFLIGAMTRGRPGG